MAVAYALASAALFGLSTPAAKLLLGTLDPFLLAGLLYCGAGVGIVLLRRLWPWIAAPGGASQAALSRADFPWLAAAVTAGGIAGPLLLMWGLARTGASTASLMLTLEGAATALIAWFVFQENFDRRILLGVACLLAGAVTLAWSGAPSLDNLLGPLAIAGACAAWGFDNNFTRKLAHADPLQIVQWKGVIAGPINLVLGLSIGAALPSWPILLLSGATGFVGYGVSLVLYVAALRHLGAARTGAYFSTAPFVAAAASILVLGEPVTARLVIAGALMGLGVWLHVTEHHEHRHTHEPLTHAHAHRHDEHHQHVHRPEDPPGEPHTHWHEHEPVTHTHAHTPDMHHVHRH